MSLRGIPINKLLNEVSDVVARVKPSIKCPICGRVSYHPEDVKNSYCAFCNKFWGDNI